MRHAPLVGTSFALLVLLSVGWRAHASGGSGGAELRLLLKTNRTRMLVQQASRRLSSQPDALEPMVWLGIAWSRIGYYPDAAGAFSLVAGGDLYEELGLEAHATALRELGAGQAALDLRLQRLVHADVTDAIEVRLRAQAVDDLRMAGDSAGAEAQALHALALFPGGPLAQILLAEVAMDRGDLEEAASYLWVATQLGGTPMVQSLWRAQLRWALLSGDPLAIAEGVAAYGAIRSPEAQTRALYAEALRQQGEPAAALEVLQRARLELTEDPAVLGVRARVAADLADVPTTRDEVDRLKAAYPHHPETIATLAHVRRTLPRLRL